MRHIRLSEETYTRYLAWSCKLAQRAGMLGHWNKVETSVARAFDGEDPATFTPGHPEYRGKK